jgi:hypothetical protein
VRWLPNLLYRVMGQLSRHAGWLSSVAARFWRIGLALALVVGPLAIGVPLLTERNPTRAEPVSVGFVPPTPAKPGRGFTIGLAATIHDCDQPLDVTVVAAGTAEYWLDNADRLRGNSTFQLALPNVLDKPKLRPGTTATDVVDPATTELRKDDPPLLTGDDFRYESVPVDSAKDGDELTIVRGTIRNWPSSLVPIIADFKADWTEDRGLGSCFVQLPAIAGDYSILSAQRARGMAKKVEELVVDFDDLTVDSRNLGIGAPYDASLELAYGTATVRTPHGSIDLNDSLPQPTVSVNGNPTWTCTGQARAATVLDEDADKAPAGNYVLLGPSLRGTAGALSTQALVAGPAGDCSAVVVVVESSARWTRDLLLLLIGAFVSLGVAILVELALGFRSAVASGAAR